MTMHINLSCLQILELVPRLTFQICGCTWAKMMRCRRGRLQFKRGEDDEDISTTDITIPPILIQGPITRSRARQLKQQVNSFLCSSSCENENRLLPNDVLVLRNEGEGHGVLMEHQGRAGEQGGRAPPVGSRVQLNFESTSESRSRPHQN